jgi:hypothetical protein
MQCKSGKRSFETENDALAVEKSNRERFNTEVQYPYKCEDCTSFHLTSLPPGTGTMGRIDFSRAANGIVRQGQGGKIHVAPSIESKIHELYAKSPNALAVSREVSLPYCVVRRILGLKTIPREGNNPRVPKTIESIEERKAELRRQLASLDDQERQFREQNELKVVVEGAVTVIQKGHESLHLFAADVNALVEKLMDKLTEGAAA